MLRTVAELGFEQSTPIQTGAIPPALLGSDVIGQAQTGSGKTAAFGIPMVERLDPDSDTLQALVLCPTRELAVQVHDDLARLSRAGCAPWPSTAATRCHASSTGCATTRTSWWRPPAGSAITCSAGRSR